MYSATWCSICNIGEKGIIGRTQSKLWNKVPVVKFFGNTRKTKSLNYKKKNASDVNVQPSPKSYLEMHVSEIKVVKSKPVIAMIDLQAAHLCNAMIWIT